MLAPLLLLVLLSAVPAFADFEDRALFAQVARVCGGHGALRDDGTCDCYARWVGVECGVSSFTLSSSEQSSDHDTHHSIRKET